MPLFIDNNQIKLTDQSEELWSLNLNEVRLIGEYTTNQGPYLDDYFFVFANSKENLLQASNMQIEDSSLWIILSEKLGIEMSPQLFASTEWNSKIIYPQNLKGKKLFEVITENNERRTFFDKLFGTNKKTERIELTTQVKEVFKKSV